MDTSRSRMVVSPRWLLAAILTLIVGFSVLMLLAYLVQTQHPPIPAQVVSTEGATLFTAADVMRGQHLFQKHALMQYGTIFGHGAYLGPDFTAQYLHAAAAAMGAHYRASGLRDGETAERVRQDFEQNRLQGDTLTFTAAQAAALRELESFYARYFAEPAQQSGLRRPTITDPRAIHDLTAYFAWAAWACTAHRPGNSYSYTNDWPPEPAAGNQATADALFWSAVSLVALLGGLGLTFYAFGKWDLLGWHGAQAETGTLRFRPPDEVRLTPAQRAVPWYFAVVAGLFLVQGLLGGANAHYHVEPSGFFGIDVAAWFPYNLTRMWHLQLALFFVATSFLAMGIFIAPMLAGREPRHQAKLALALFVAVVVVAVGSLLGEAAGLRNAVTLEGPWFWVGPQGWEYLDLGRLWQALLVAGMVFWVAILYRGLRGRLAQEHVGNMPWLFLFSAISIPLFYAVGMFFGKNSNFTVMDFWRFWVVHLWVEDFLELFTTIMVASIFVLLHVVRVQVATRVVYLDIILYSLGGVIGTMHHLYFSGAPAVHMALGAVFSAMEVIPLVLLSYEAWRFMQLGSNRAQGAAPYTSSAEFPHKWAVMFLIAVGFWNFLGAGVFGFLINLPIISYYEIGTAWTANHGHGAMMGVYGMLALGFFMFVARYFVPRDRGSERAMRWSFWSLNVGLAWMLFVNLAPIGALQVYDAVANGYWHARDPAFGEATLVRTLEWLRLPGDALFIVGGILPVVYLALRMLAHRKRPGQVDLDGEAEKFMTGEPARP
ncbi:MAG: cbb3-type cytochrome c oxidase subunit I [Acidobacteria bacterium]|nr:cbb3-type cytochrome c oxidase subunit I [Acidobacteriota bacterium]